MSDDALAAAWQAPVIDPEDTAERRAAKRRQQRDDSFSQAKEEGFAAGMALGSAEVSDQKERFGRLLSELSAPFEQLDEEVEHALVDLACRIARQVVRRELQTDRAQIVAVAREALHALPVAARDVKLTLHPDDAALLREAMASSGETRSWELNEDPLLTRGGLRIVTATSILDASVEARLDTVIRQLVREERSNVRGGENRDQ